LFYYATEVAFIDGAEEDGRLKKRLQDLVGDALIVAEQVRSPYHLSIVCANRHLQAKFDVFNALTLMDNNEFLQDLKVTCVPTSLSAAKFLTDV